MSRFPTLLLAMIMPFLGQAQTASFADYPAYDGDDLGVAYARAATRIRVWAPSAEAVMWRLYTHDLNGNSVEEVSLRRSREGTWTGTLPGNWKGYYYTVQARFGSDWRLEVPDPYARAAGRNGLRGQIVDMAETNPDQWEQDRRPVLARNTDAVLYEAHVRDMTIHPSSGVEHPGKFLGMAESGTLSPEGQPTGLDHLRALGITHVHFLPFFDFGSLDETVENPGYNWGYDPMNYNVPEGTYCTNPADGASRIRELKTMVQALHAAGIGVVMDVVYNHTYDAAKSNFEQLVPGYFYRHNSDGSLSNASGCGNETASERPMVRRFMQASVRYWATEYHLDGFRFDLMGVHDQETMRKIRADLDGIAPGLMLYGEGWTAGPSPLPESERALKKSTYLMPGVAAFSDDFRDAIKGHWANEHDAGFASGRQGLSPTIKMGLVGGIAHPELDFSRVNYSKKAWALTPAQSVHYVSCHDNHTLYDKLRLAAPNASDAERLAMLRLSNTLVILAQGIPFLHAGVEMARTKGGEHNSYKSPDSVNAINWNRQADYEDLMVYFRDLLALRREHPVFRMDDPDMVRSAASFLDTGTEHAVALLLDGGPAGDSWKEVLLVANGSGMPYKLDLPGDASWNLAGNGRVMAADGLLNLSRQVEVAAYSAYLLFR